MKRHTAVFVAFTVFASASSVLATTYVVKPDGTGDFPTIQDAVAAADDWDVIELTDGVFTDDGNRDISNLGKFINIVSQSGDPEACVIDCEGWYDDMHRGFHLYFEGGGGPGIWGIEGIKIIHGWQLLGGAVLLTDGADPLFFNCIFEGSTGRDGGGAVYCEDSNPVFVSCEFHENATGEACGGAIYFTPLCYAEIRGCTFWMNAAITGGAIYHEEAALGTTLARCTFYGNMAGGGSALFLGGYSFASISNSIFYSHWKSPPVYCTDIGTVMLSCCDIYGNEYGDWAGCIADQYGINGNISKDPLFCKQYWGDFSLHMNSPCAPFTPPNSECDLIGAWDVGCGGTPVGVETWSTLKSKYRAQ